MEQDRLRVFRMKNEEKNIEINAISTKYGNKLVISTPYNAHLVENIKKTDWEKTHRTFDSQTKAWTIDLTLESLMELRIKRNLISDYQNDEVYNIVMSHITGICNILQTNPELDEKETKEDKFLDAFVPCSSLLVVDYEYVVDRYKGAFSQMVIQCNKQVNGIKPTFIFAYSRKNARKGKLKYGRMSSNPFGELADFFNVARSEFNEILKKSKADVIRFINERLSIEGERIIKISATRMDNFKLDNYQNQYRVFNIATEVHQTVTFSKIRELIIKFMENKAKIEENEAGGSIVWVCKTFTTHVNKREEALSGFVIISSGNNVKRSSIKVIGKIKVGSCDNSIVAFEEVYIKHTTNWEERFTTALQDASNTLVNATKVIETSMEQNLSFEDGCKIIDAMDFGLKNESIVEKVRGLVKNRLKFEMNKKTNRWALSQSLSYIGTHEAELDSIQIEPTENLMESLQLNSFQVINNSLRGDE